MKTDIGFDKVAFANAVQREVSRLPHAKAEQKQTTFLCPFHSEKTPSAKVNHDPASPYLGRFFCWGCPKTSNSMGWKEFAERMNLDQLDGNEFRSEKVPEFFAQFYEQELLGQTKEEPVEAKTKDDVRDLSFTLKNAVRLGLEDGTWRGFEYKFLKTLDNIRFRKRFKKDDDGNWKEFWCLRLPVVVNGKEYGHTDALFEKPAKGTGTSYLNKKGSWSKTHALFPFDQAIRLMNELGIKTIVLVEGPRDALRLIRAGIPAVAIFGTKSWSMMKVRLLQLAGVERIILCMDGDSSGRDATDHILPTIEDGFEVKVIKLWVVARKLKLDKIDPGNMPTGVLRRLERAVLRDPR